MTDNSDISQKSDEILNLSIDDINKKITEIEQQIIETTDRISGVQNQMSVHEIQEKLLENSINSTFSDSEPNIKTYFETSNHIIKQYYHGYENEEDEIVDVETVRIDSISQILNEIEDIQLPQTESAATAVEEESEEESEDFEDDDIDDDIDIEDVIVPLPEESIMKLPSFPYDSTFMTEICNICLDEFKDNDWMMRDPKCGKMYHTICLYTWFERSCYCPACRFDFRELKESHNLFF